MKQFLSFVKKEFYHIFRDVRTILILLGMPIAQILLFGFAITTEVKNTQVAVFDLSKDAVTEQIIQKIQANEYFSLVENLNNPDRIEQVLREGKASMVLVFGNDFQSNMLHTGEAAVQVIVDATDPNQATTMTNYITNILSQYQQEIAGQSGSPNLKIVPQVKMLYNPQMESAYNFVPGVMGLILMLICAMMTSIAIVREKEKGSMEILLTSPIRPIFIIISKAVPYLTLSIVNLITILLLSVFVLKVPVAGSLPLIFLASFMFILVALQRKTKDPFFAFGASDFKSSGNTGCGYARIGNGINDAYHALVGYDVPYRKYAGCFAMGIEYNACEMVYKHY